MKEEFDFGLFLITVNNNLISDFGKTPQRFKSFLRALDNINGINVIEMGGFTFILSPPSNWQGDPSVYLLCIENIEKKEERSLRLRGRKPL